MATVILGGGIIGLSTAYELSLARPPLKPGNPPIHIVDSSHSLLLSASGLAGGFVAEDWFSPASASLGALSFRLHRELAEQHDGQRRWGYAGSHVYSLSISGKGVYKSRSKPASRADDDWLSSGTSRAGVAPGSSSPLTAAAVEPLNADGSPACFTPQPGGTLSTMGTPDDCAQVDPHALCSFLLSESRSRGVQVHLSATPTAITTDAETSAISGLTYTSTRTNESSKTETILPCTNFVLAAGAWTPSLFRTLFPQSGVRIPIYPLAGYSLLVHSPRYTTPFELGAPTNTTSIGAEKGSSNPAKKQMCYAIYTSPTPPSFRGSGWSYAPEAFARLAPATATATTTDIHNSNSSNNNNTTNTTNSLVDDNGRKIDHQQQPEIWIGGLNAPSLPLPARAEQVKALAAPEAVADLRGVLVQLCGKLAESPETQNGDGDVGGRKQILNEDDLRTVREGLCFRPVSETGVPVIGQIAEKMLGRGDGKKAVPAPAREGEREGEGKGGVFVATGHGPWGISLSLGTGRVVSELVLGKETSADISRLGLR